MNVRSEMINASIHASQQAQSHQSPGARNRQCYWRKHDRNQETIDSRKDQKSQLVTFTLALHYILRGMMSEFDAISRWFKHNGMRQGRALQFIRRKITLDTVNSHDCLMNLRQSFQRGYLDGKVMKTHVVAAIKTDEILFGLPTKRNQGVSAGKKIAGIRLVSANLGISNSFKELEGTLEVVHSKTHMRNARGQLRWCGRSHVVLFCFSFCGFVR
jgi:hypothetical protein